VNVLVTHDQRVPIGPAQHCAFEVATDRLADQPDAGRTMYIALSQFAHGRLRDGWLPSVFGPI